MACVPEPEEEIEGPCDVTVTSHPSAGAVDVYYRSDIEFRLTRVDPTATIETNISGYLETSADGLTKYWRLDTPLEPLTAYEATLHFCPGDARVWFETSELGVPLEAPEALNGQTFLMDVANSRMTEPREFQSWVFGEIGALNLYARVLESREQAFNLLEGFGSETAPDRQEYCDPTTLFRDVDFSESPYFRTQGSGVDMVVPLGWGDVRVRNLHTTGTFAPDGRSFGGGTLSGVFKASVFDEALYDGERGAACRQLERSGSTCVPCSEGDADLECMTLQLDSFSAEAVSVELVPIDGEDCRGCEAGVPLDASESCEQG